MTASIHRYKHLKFHKLQHILAQISELGNIVFDLPIR